MSKGKGKPTVAVYMRLEPEVARRLDELAESTAGSRGDVVKALVGQAVVRHVTMSVPTVALASGEAVTDD